MTDRPQQIKGLLWGIKISSHQKGGGCNFSSEGWRVYLIKELLLDLPVELPMDLSMDLPMDLPMDLTIVTLDFLLTFVACCSTIFSHDCSS